MGLLPEPILNKIYRDKHNLEYIDSISHIPILKQDYADIRRYTKQVYGGKFPQMNINVPIKTLLIPLQKSIID